MDWATETDTVFFAKAWPACPGTNQDGLTTANAPPFTARNYSSFTSALTTTSAPSVTATTISAAVISTDITGVIYGTASGSISAASTSTSSASVLVDRLVLRLAVVVSFSSVYVFAV